jgi:hypothetical protein
VPVHLELPPERFAAGEPVAAALTRFTTFLRPDDELCCWGRFPLDLLAADGVVVGRTSNVRELAARALERSPGGPEQAATALTRGAVPRAAWSDGRAGRRIAALGTILDALLAAPPPA